MENIESILEIKRIKDEVSSFAYTAMAKDRIASLSSLSLDELEEELSLLNEMFTSLPLDGKVPLSYLDDLSKQVLLASKGAMLSKEDIHRLSFAIGVALDAKHHFSKVEWNGKLKDLALSLPALSFLKEKIDSIVGPDLEILDNASPLLKSIRNNISRLEREVNRKANEALSKYKEYLTNTNLSLRNGHFVLSVANAYKSKVPGIIEDISSSGGTIFIQPEYLVAHHNKIAEAKLQEKNEIARLLTELSGDIGKRNEELADLYVKIGKIDFIQAKALYGDKYDCHIPELSKDGKLYLPNARHPLLDQNKVVPNTFILSEDKPLIVISGPNAGGKTVALKTLAVSVMMFKMGLMVASSQGASIPYFKRVFADIGDSQSLSDNLSTFSGHMSKIAEITSLAGGKDLVILDELGTGTAPKEGEAIAIAVAEYLLKKHSFALISSHFEGLKSLALSNPHIENASMLFDDEKLLPTYKLVLGLPGESYGLEVARRYGVNDEILAKAKDISKRDTDISVTEAIKKLGILTKENEDLNLNLTKKNEQLNRATHDLENREKALNNKREKLEKEMHEKQEALINEAKEKITEALKLINNPQIKPSELGKARKELEKLIEEKEEVHFNEEINVGDYVMIPSYNVEGPVTAVKSNKITIVSSGMTINADKSLATHIDRPKEIKGRTTHMTASRLDNLGGTSLKLECNLIGMRAEPAKEELINYLDKCRVKGFKRVRIIHGFGSGILRKVVREYLDSRKDFVDRYEGATESEGAGGATVVYLK